MAKISLSAKFIKETLMLFKERSLKEIFFGKKVELTAQEEMILQRLKENSEEFRKNMGRQGTFVKIDSIHKGVGMVYLLPNKIGNDKTESLIFFDRDTKITAGPDLWIYLSTSEDVKRNGLGEYLPLTLLKGTKGGQKYIINKPIIELQKYKSVVIWCKQFAVLFTYAVLS